MINSVVLMGRLTYEPELKATSESTSFINFQLAVDRGLFQGLSVLVTLLMSSVFSICLHIESVI